MGTPNLAAFLAGSLLLAGAPLRAMEIKARASESVEPAAASISRLPRLERGLGPAAPSLSGMAASAVAPAGAAGVVAAPASAVVAPAAALVAPAAEAIDSAQDLAPVLKILKGISRKEWLLDDKALEYVGGGSYKDLLAHPDSSEHLITLFAQVGTGDFSQEGAGSLSASRFELKRELAGRAPLESAGLSPKTGRQGGLEVIGRDGSSRDVTYFIQERVRGRDIEHASRQDIDMVARLFDRLVELRVRLADRRNMRKNIMLGSTVSSPRPQAWVVDAGEAQKDPPRTWKDDLLRRPDALRAFYDEILSELRANPGVGVP